MLIYIIYFLVIAVIAVEYNFNKFNRWPILVLLVFVIALLAGLRGSTVSSDYDNNKYSFDASVALLQELKRGIIFGFFEPGYLITVAILKNISELNYTVYIMIFFAFASITLKVITIDKLSLNPFLAILFYFSHYFVLLEMTQIRIGFASALFFVAINSYLKGNTKAFVLWVLLACTFHYSALLYFVVLLFNYKTLNRPLYLFVLLFSIALGIFKPPLFEVINQINPELITGKLKGYDYMLKHSVDMKINTFNITYIINVLSVLYIILFIPKVSLQEDRKLIFFMKCNILSLFLLSLLSGVPNIAFRMSELFGITSIFMFAGLVNYLPFKKLNIVFLILLAAVFFYINYFHNKLLSPYYIENFK